MGCPAGGDRTSRSIPGPVLPVTAGVLGLLLLAPAGCGGPLSWRSVAEFAAEVPVAPGIKTVRIEVQNGSIGVEAAGAGVVSVAGGLRRAADTEEELARLERIPAGLEVVADPARPETLVLRGPVLPPDAKALLAFELRAIRVPADLALEVVVAANGHVTVARREAATTVTTARGDLRFEDCRGSIDARTRQGRVIAFGHHGDLALHTGVGDMQALVREPGTRLLLETGSGTIQCFVPPATEFDVDARAEVGKIGNGFGLPVTKPSKYSAAMVGRQGSGRTKVILRTGDGALSFAPK